MKPNFRIITDGKDLTEAIKSRLLSLSIKDESGFKSDSLSLILADEPPIEWPKDGQVFEIAIGYEDVLVNIGSFAAKHIAVSGPPRTLKIEATALQQNKSLGSQREESWEQITFGDIVGEIARRNQLRPAVSGDLRSIQIEHEDQTESDIAFLTRLGRRYDAVIKVSRGFLVASKSGKAQTVSGSELPRIIIASPISFEYSGDQTKGYTGVRTFWYDSGEARKNYILAGREGVVLDLQFNKTNEHEARAAAEAKFHEVARKGKTLSLTMTGNPELAAERKCLLSGIREGVDGEWIIKSVEHTIDGSGFLSKVECEVDGYHESKLGEFEDDEELT